MAGTAAGMRYFKEDEFQGWADQLAPQLKDQLDQLRARSGHPIMVSPEEGAVGREYGPEHPKYASRHNVERWGEVQAVDVMPYKEGPNGEPRGLTAAEREAFYREAKAVGFGGIGVYPQARPYPMFHLDVRPMGDDGEPATWAGLRPGAGASGWKYVALERGLQPVGRETA